MVVSGSVGDGPITGAEIRVTDAFGSLIVSGTSDSSAAYQLDIPDGTALPVTVEATGGVDLVTGRSAEFPLRGASFATGDVTVNLSPYTTLALGIAQCQGRLTESRLNFAWVAIDASVNLGWVSSVIANPMSDPVTEANVATVLLSNEALGEVARRAAAALTNAGIPTEPGDVIDGLACDLADGRLDAVAQGVEARVMASTVGALLSVQLEVLAGQLHVDGQIANGLLDDALATVMPGSTSSVLDVGVAEGLLQQTLNSIAVLRGVYDDTMLFDLATALGNASMPNLRSVAQSNVASLRGELVNLAERIALADETLISTMQQRLVAVVTASQPTMSFTAADASVLAGAGTTLSWAVTGVEQCRADGSWTGERNTDGVFPTGSLNVDSDYGLSCVGLGGVASGRVLVSVMADPGNNPFLTISAQPASVAPGGSATLSWTASNADSCTAGGAWTGSRSTTGSEVVGPLTSSATFSLTCNGAGGNAMEMLVVNIDGQVTVEWEAPTENVDGTALTDLSGYRIYYGDSSGIYTGMIEVTDPQATMRTFDLTSGSYFVAMTALDVDDNESAYSNEIVKTVQ